MVSIFSKYIKQHAKKGKWLIITIISLLCIFQMYTLNVIYHDTKNAYNYKINSFLPFPIDQINLTKSSKATLSYCSYNPPKHKLRIIKNKEKIDTTIQLAPNEDLRLAMCQAGYDIRDTNIWHLDSLGLLLVKTLKKASLYSNFTLTLTDEQGNTLDTFRYGKPVFAIQTIQKEINLGFLERHKLTATFIYPFHYFWDAAWDKIINTICLFILLIISSVSLFIQLRTERRINKYRKKFTHTLVHNLRSPLLYLKHQLEEPTITGTFPQEHQIQLQEAHEKLTEVLKNIEKLLSTSVNAYGLVAQRELFRPEEIFTKTAAVYRQSLPDKKADIRIQCDGCGTIYADPTLLEGALGNLIGNSIKYSGPEVSISLSCQKINKKIRISVQDNGFGIPPEEQTYIFRENFRGKHYTHDKKYKGYGLGLYYVQAVAIAHRGKLSVKSDGQNGSLFTIEFPAKKYRL